MTIRLPLFFALVFVPLALLAQETTSPPKAKRVWTNDNISGSGKAAAAGPSASGCVADPQAIGAATALKESPQTKLSADERRALEFVIAIGWLEGVDCKVALRRACSLDELVKTVRTPGQRGSIIGLTQDPRADSNYEYVVKVTGEQWEISATPKRSGLGGFLSEKGEIVPGMHFNPKGPASSTDPAPRYNMEVKGLTCNHRPPK